MPDERWAIRDLPEFGHRAQSFIAQMAALGIPQVSVTYVVPGIGKITASWTQEGYEEDDDGSTG